MKKMRFWLLICSVLLIAALIPAVAGADGQQITQVTITRLSTPYVETPIPGRNDGVAKFARFTTTAGGTTSAEQSNTSVSNGWYEATTGYGPFADTVDTETFDAKKDYYLYLNLQSPESTDYFAPSFHQSSIKFGSDVKVKPYKIEIQSFTENRHDIWAKLYFHSVNNYSMAFNTPGTPRNIWFKRTGIFAEKVYEGETPSKEYQIDNGVTRATDFTVSNVQWHEAGSTAVISYFKAETSYEVTCELTPVAGYAEFGTTSLNVFRDAIYAGGTYGTDTNVKVEWAEGKEGQVMKVTYYPETAKRISKIALKNIQTPVVGQKPQTTGVAADKKAVKVSIYKWLDEEGKDFTGTFQYKETYTLWLKMQPEAGWSFSETIAKTDIDPGDCTGTLTKFQKNAPGGPGTEEANTLYIAIEFKTGKPPAGEDCSVTFDANGGSGTMAGATVKKGEMYTLPVCGFTAPAGKEFDTWDKGAPGTQITITADTVIKAQWKDAACTITFDANGGKGTMEALKAEKGKAVKLTKNAFQKKKAAFRSWNTKADGTGTEYKDEAEIMVSGDTVLYAQWSKASLKLSSIKVQKGKKAVISVTLKIDDKAVKGKIVTFTFNGKTYTAKTNKKGIAKVTIKASVTKKLTVGKKVKITAAFEGTTVKKNVKVTK